MVFTFLGTSAADQYPGLWCSCENCNKARQAGGRNIRLNSSAALGAHTLIDFGPAIPIQLAKCGLSLLAVEELLITHAHDDHFFPWYLRWRLFKEGGGGPAVTKPLPLVVYGNERVKELTLAAVKNDLLGHGLEIVVLKPWETVTTKYVRCTPILANHDFRQECFNFILEYKGKTILYAVDTAWFLPQAREFLTSYRFDLVVMEGTYGFKNNYDDTAPGHAGFDTNKRAREWLLAADLIDESTTFAITHISPHDAPPHEECASLLKKWGLTLAYDGLQIEL